MAKHRHWFFVPAFDANDLAFQMLKNDEYLPQNKTDVNWDKLRLIINGGEGNCDSFEGIGDDDRIYIYGHSNGTALGSKAIKYETVKILNLLETYGLTPGKARVFKLFGCTTGAELHENEDTFAKKFFQIAKVRHPGCTVYGYVGFLRLGKIGAHSQVYTNMTKDEKNRWRLMPGTNKQAKEMRVAFSDSDNTLEQNNTRWVLEQGEGWAMVTQY